MISPASFLLIARLEWKAAEATIKHHGNPGRSKILRKFRMPANQRAHSAAFNPTGHRVCALIDVFWRTEPVLFNRAQTLRSDVDQLLAALVRIGVAEAARLERALLASTPDG